MTIPAGPRTSPAHRPGVGRVPSSHFFSPPCRLRLEGENQPEATCEILELSPEGVKIAIRGDQLVHQGQHGRLVIGQPDGDHYEVPVDVNWVKVAASQALLGLSLPTPSHWRFARS